MRRTCLRAMTIVMALGLPLRAATAQRVGAPHRLEFGAVVGRVTADGDDFTGTKAALGFGGTVRYMVAPHVSLGVGVHYSDHGIETLPEHLQIRVVYAESRLVLPVKGSALRVFAGARGGWAHERITIVDWTANGWVAGGMVGTDWRLAPFVSLELQVSHTVVHLGDRKTSSGSTAGTAVHGSSLGLQGGFLLTL